MTWHDNKSFTLVPKTESEKKTKRNETNVKEDSKNQEFKEHTLIYV